MIVIESEQNSLALLFAVNHCQLSGMARVTRALVNEPTPLALVAPVFR
jgi:hypothetical protein